MVRSLRYLFAFLLTILAGNAMAQIGYIAGKVIDENKEPVIGAIVRVTEGGVAKGGATTDVDGNYTIKPLQAGRYELEVTYTGYKKNVTSGVLVNPDQGSTVNVKMEVSKATNLAEATVTASKYEAPLIDPFKNVGTLTRENIKNLPTRNTSDFASLTPGVYQGKSGGNVNIGGSRSEGTLYIIDGVQVNGASSINQSPDLIDQMQVYSSGVPAKYGDASGGVISITTRGVSKDFTGGITLEHSVDGYNTNLASFNINGPLIRKTVDGYKKPVIGFVLAGDYRYDVDNDPTYFKNYVVKDDKMQSLQQHPIVAVEGSNGVSTFKPAAEYITAADLDQQKQRVNALSKRASLTGKLNYEVAPGTNITAGGSFFYRDAYNYSRTAALFAPDAITKSTGYTGRGYLRFTQRFGKANSSGATTPGEEKKENVIQNAYYSVQADYQRDYTGSEDPNHKHNAFEYGYVGKFVENQTAVFVPGTDDSIGKIGIRLAGYTAAAPISFTRSEINPLLANYTSSYQDLGGSPIFLMSNIGGNASGAYLRNGDGPNSVYSLWSNVGASASSYNMNQSDQFSLSVDASFDYKMKKSTHNVEFGLYYQQRAERGYGVNGSSLWGLMRQLTHRAISGELDLANPIYVVGGQQYTKEDIRNGVVAFGPSDTVLYNRKFDATAAPVGGFDYNIRKKLGLGQHDYVQPDAYDPSTFSLGMFTADELLDGGQARVSYNGYDYTGKMVTGQVNFNDFFTKKDEHGNYTRPIGAYRPNYIAGYLSDKIKFKDLLFSLGVRVERFDNNTKVLKDPYSLYSTYTVGENDGLGANSAKNLINGGSTPSNIGKDYVVYVNNNNSTSPSVIGYRNGETWYDPKGKEITDPSVLRNYSNGLDPQPYLQSTTRISDSAFQPDQSFTDYKPTVNVMPRISFSFPINTTSSFYAHYDVIFQRPKPGVGGSVLTGFGAYASPFDYYYLTQNSNSIIGNPDLKPEKNISYEVGFTQALSRLSAITLNAFYKERKDQIQVRPYVFAYPTTYYTYGNRDYSTTKGLGIKYELRRTNNISMTIAYTLQFAEGTGSSATSGNGGSSGGVSAGGLLSYLVSAHLPNLLIPNSLDYDSRHIIAANLDYRYAEGEGPVVGGKHIFQETGLNFLLQTHSGEPYTRYAQAQTLQSGVNNPNVLIGGINGSRLPWHFILNAKLDKNFAMDFRKSKEDGTVKGKKFYLNAYVFVQNLLNQKDVLSVYRYTGQADDDGYLSSPAGAVSTSSQTNAQSYTDLYQIRMVDPGRYNNPRRIVVGIQFNF